LRIQQLGRLLPRRIVIANCLFAFACLLGCSSPRARDFSSQVGYPDSALSALPIKVAEELNAFSSTVTLPQPIRFKDTEELGRVYSEWYRKGYAFAFITGKAHVREWSDRADTFENAKSLGWFDGNSAGGLARRQRDVDSAFDRLQAPPSKAILTP